MLVPTQHIDKPTQSRFWENISGSLARVWRSIAMPSRGCWKSRAASAGDGSCCVPSDAIGWSKHIMVIYWWVVSNRACHHPNWRTPSFFRGVGIPPSSLSWEKYVETSWLGFLVVGLPITWTQKNGWSFSGFSRRDADFKTQNGDMGGVCISSIWVNYNDLAATSLEIMVSKGNHPQMGLVIQGSEIL